MTKLEQLKQLCEVTDNKALQDPTPAYQELYGAFMHAGLPTEIYERIVNAIEKLVEERTNGK